MNKMIKKIYMCVVIVSCLCFIYSFIYYFNLIVIPVFKNPLFIIIGVSTFVYVSAILIVEWKVK